MKLSNIVMLVEGPREEYVINNMGPRLLQRAQQDAQASKDINQLVDQLSAIDPTNNKQYLQWIAKQYLNKLFRIEDASRIHELLVNFNQLKPRLAKKDINQYKLHDLEQEIDNIMQGGETDNMKQSNYDNVADAEYLYKGPLGTLVVPKTEAASCELGRGTKWCTAAEKNNMFDTYHEDGNLYIWIDRSGKKYQFWFNNSEDDDGFEQSYQIMDARDVEVPDLTLKQLFSIPPIKQHLYPRFIDALTTTFDAATKQFASYPTWSANSFLDSNRGLIDRLDAFGYRDYVVEQLHNTFNVRFSNIQGLSLGPALKLVIQDFAHPLYAEFGYDITTHLVPQMVEIFNKLETAVNEGTVDILQIVDYMLYGMLDQVHKLKDISTELYDQFLGILDKMVLQYISKDPNEIDHTLLVELIDLKLLTPSTIELVNQILDNSDNPII